MKCATNSQASTSARSNFFHYKFKGTAISPRLPKNSRDPSKEELECACIVQHWAFVRNASLLRGQRISISGCDPRMSWCAETREMLSFKWQYYLGAPDRKSVFLMTYHRPATELQVVPTDLILAKRPPPVLNIIDMTLERTDSAYWKVCKRSMRSVNKALECMLFKTMRLRLGCYKTQTLAKSKAAIIDGIPYLMVAVFCREKGHEESKSTASSIVHDDLRRRAPNSLKGALSCEVFIV